MKPFNHNILQNRDLLKDLLRQIDALNTINGGSAMASVDIIGSTDSIVILVAAPTVPVESYSILLNYSKLTVSIFPKEEHVDHDHNPVFVPMFMRTFDIPAFVDLDAIEAVHENDELQVILPFKTSMDNLLRMIDIKEL